MVKGEKSERSDFCKGGVEQQGDESGVEVEEMTKVQKKAKEIVDAILKDLTDRRGRRQEWEAIGEDIRGQIRAAWIDVTAKRLAGEDFS